MIGNGFKLKDESSTLDVRKGCLEALEQVVQGSCGCPIPASAQGQMGWCPEQPCLALSVPMVGARNYMILKFPSNPNHSMVCDSRKVH